MHAYVYACVRGSVSMDVCMQVCLSACARVCVIVLIFHFLKVIKTLHCVLDKHCYVYYLLQHSVVSSE